MAKPEHSMTANDDGRLDESLLVKWADACWRRPGWTLSICLLLGALALAGFAGLWRGPLTDA